MNTNMQENKIALLLTGQMRSYNKCWNNLEQNIIKANPQYKYEIFILTEFKGKNGGSKKNKYINKDDNLKDFVDNINQTYKNYVIKQCIIENETMINYPSYVGNYGPFICLYRNKILMNQIKDDYAYYIRLRPDIVLTGPLRLPQTVKKTINIVCGKQQRSNKSWLHNRDWDHMALGDYDSMLNWCNYVDYLQYTGTTNFTEKCPYQTTGQWYMVSSDRSVVCTQLFLLSLKKKGYDVVFDYDSIYTIPIRN